MFSYFGMMPPPTFGSAGQPVADPPSFTTQPEATTLFQRGGLLSIGGAVVTGYTSLIWQRNDDGTWNDVAGQTGATLSIQSAGDIEGAYRIKAVNGNSAPAYSNEVAATEAYLNLVADLNSNTGADKITKGADDFTYSGAIVRGQRYYSARVIVVATGVDQGRSKATWVTSDAKVAPITSVSTTGQLRSDVPTGTAGQTVTITATFGNLSSKMTLTS